MCSRWFAPCLDFHCKKHGLVRSPSFDQFRTADLTLLLLQILEFLRSLCASEVQSFLFDNFDEVLDIPRVLEITGRRITNLVVFVLQLRQSGKSKLEETLKERDEAPEAETPKACLCVSFFGGGLTKQEETT